MVVGHSQSKVGKPVGAPSTTRPIRNRMRRGKIGKVGVFSLLVALSAIFLFPFFWIVSSALQSTSEQDHLPLTWFPAHPEWHNFLVAWSTLPFATFLLHSAIIVGFATFGAVASSSLCAYGFARLRFRGRDVWFYVVLSTMMLPGVVTLIPVYLIMRDLGWLNTVLPLIVPIYFGGGAFNIFLIRQFMLGIPRELEDAAQIDGASSVLIFFRIVLPLVKPVLAVTAWFTALASWGDFLGPLIYLNIEKSWTFTLGLYEFPGMMPFGWGDQLEMAMAVISMAPVIIGFFFIQNWLIEGVNLAGIVR